FRSSYKNVPRGLTTFGIKGTPAGAAMKLDPKTTAVVAIDMHRGHLDPAVATLPLPAERCPPLIARARALFTALRSISVPIVHVVTVARDPQETLANPFWNAIADD